MQKNKNFKLSKTRNFKYFVLSQCIFEVFSTFGLLLFKIVLLGVGLIREHFYERKFLFF